MTTIVTDYISEPKLQFGSYFEHEDPKTGLREYGPFGKNVPGLHRTEIKLGFIGTRETISMAQEWITTCGTLVESETIRRQHRASSRQTEQLFDLPDADDQPTRMKKILNPDFVGFNRESAFDSCFQLNPRWERSINKRDLDGILAIEDKSMRIQTLVERLDRELASLAATPPSPDIVIVALTPEMVSQAHDVQISGTFHLNLRRAIKARAMQHGIPVQILQERTVTGEGGEVQERATRAWNFCTAMYYKAQGVPWRLLSIPPDVCFVGIDFFVAADLDGRLTLRSCVAQAFDYLGQGLVLRGDPFEWDEELQGRSPHLSDEGARKLIRDTLTEYERTNSKPPTRVVVHKRSEFWGASHPSFNELEGFYAGIDDVYRRCDVDLVALTQTGVRLFREGSYPPARGTYACIEGENHFLYTMGFIPFLETYPGSYVPKPWCITDHHGSSAGKDLLREVLALTKMNVNNCAYADGTPITLSFSKKIGEIMKHVRPGEQLQPHYRFYM